MGKLYPDAKVEADLLPKFGAGQYGTEISALMAEPADVTYSSLWGGDLQAFILQGGAARAVPEDARSCSAPPTTCCPRLGDKMPERRDHRRARRLRPDVAEDAAQRVVLQRLPRPSAASGRSKAPYRHGAGAARPEARGREGDGGQRRQEAEP